MNYLVGKFFEDEEKGLLSDGVSAVHDAAERLKSDVQQQIRENFKVESPGFINQVAIDHQEYSSTVRLSRILSSFAEPTVIRGNPNLWILLPDGERLGFKRIGKSFSWSSLRDKYGKYLFFTSVGDGVVVVYRNPNNGRNYAIYKLVKALEQSQKIDFYSKGEAIAQDLEISFEKSSNQRI